MDILNDDIVIKMLSYLSISDQLTMLEVHPRFHNLMATVWCLQSKTVNFSLYEVQFSTVQLHYYFESIRNRVEVLRLRMLQQQEFAVLTNYIYPKAYDFRFAQHPRHFMTDVDIKSIKTSFPNLRSFSPHGNFSGDYFVDLPHLERLTLSYCSSQFKINHLAEIMKTHHLKELKLGLFDPKHIQNNESILQGEWMTMIEVIKIHVDELPLINDHFDKLKRLKELIVCAARQNDTLWHICAKLHRARCNKLAVLETCNSTNTLRAVQHHKLHVDALKIVTDNTLLLNIEELPATMFENVRKLYLKNCVIASRTGFNNLLGISSPLEFLSLEECIFSFERYEFTSEQFTTMLTINLFQNVCSLTHQPVVWTVDGNNKLLTITNKKSQEFTFEPIYIRFK